MPNKKKNLPYRRWLAAAGLALGLVGCDTPQTISINRAQLMPDAAATKIIAKWVPNYSGADVLYIEDRAVPIKSIKLIYHAGESLLWIPILQGFSEVDGWICGMSLEEAREFTEALTARGASITLQQRARIGWGEDCNSVRALR